MQVKGGCPDERGDSYRLGRRGGAYCRPASSCCSCCTTHWRYSFSASPWRASLRAPFLTGFHPDFDSHLHPARPFILIQIVTDNARTVHYQASIYGSFYLVRCPSFPGGNCFLLSARSLQPPFPWALQVHVASGFPGARTRTSGRGGSSRRRRPPSGERAVPARYRWSALLDERPVPGGDGLLGRAWPMVTGWRDRTSATDG